MKYPALALAGFGAILGALGQVCFKYGAQGRVSLGDFINIWIVLGFLFYGAGTIAWIIALSTAPSPSFIHSRHSPTYLLIFLESPYWGESFSVNVMAGAALVILGLIVMAR